MKTTIADPEKEIILAQNAVLLTVISREYAKTARARNERVIEKCTYLLKSTDERNRGPEELKRTILEKVREKKERDAAADPTEKRRKTRLFSCVFIAAALTAMLASVAISMKAFQPAYQFVTVDKFEETIYEMYDRGDKGITDEEAIDTAYDCAVLTYGDFIRDFCVKDIAKDDFHWVIILAREIPAKDFKAFGPGCSVLVLADGQVMYCIYGGENDFKEAEGLIAGLSTADLEEYVCKQSDYKKGDFEIYEVRYCLENGKRFLDIRIGFGLKALRKGASEIAVSGSQVYYEKNDSFRYPLGE